MSMPPAGRISADDFPTTRGAYALLIALPMPLRIDIRRLGGVELPPGRYVYCGSANGPGGLRARLARHLRHDKKPHWHVDRITAVSEVIAVYIAVGGCECDLMARVLSTPNTWVPIAGFGSSDCRDCPSHLATVAPDFRLSQFLAEAVSSR